MTQHGEPAFLERLPMDPDVDEARPGVARPWSAATVGLVFAGGCVGGLLRYAVTTAWRGGADGFPWSTFAVNVAGAALLAAILVTVAERRVPRAARPLLATGFCGALTTFSSLVVSADELARHGRRGVATAYVVTTVAAALIAAAAVLWLARLVFRRTAQKPAP